MVFWINSKLTTVIITIKRLFKNLYFTQSNKGCEETKIDFKPLSLSPLYSLRPLPEETVGFCNKPILYNIYVLLKAFTIFEGGLVINLPA